MAECCPDCKAQEGPLAERARLANKVAEDLKAMVMIGTANCDVNPIALAHSRQQIELLVEVVQDKMRDYFKMLGG